MPWVNMEQYLAMGRSKFSQELLAELPMRRLEANAVSFSSAPCISEGRMNVRKQTLFQSPPAMYRLACCT